MKRMVRMRENGYFENEKAFVQKKYGDILFLEHPVSSRRPRMPLADRAAQFSPFAALTGYDAAIKETARLTDRRIELDESEKELLDAQLRQIQEKKMERQKLTITFFQPDEKKTGGAYVSVTGRIRNIDTYEKCMIMEDNRKIPVSEIVRIEGEE